MGTKNEIYTVDDKGRLRLHLHPGQTEAWDSDRRFVFIISGTQGGKTVFGPHWLLREIKQSGPGDYLVAGPTFPLLFVKAIPEFRKLFERTLRYGRYIATPIKRFEFSEYGLNQVYGDTYEHQPTTVYFGHASDPDSLEAATYKAAWLDECGQDSFSLSSWEAVQRRLSIHQGRALGTTTPYNIGWLKTEVYDRWTNRDEDYQVIQFKSISNPAFPVEEFERARATLPAWKFAMFYEALFSRPAGMIYDVFDMTKHVIPPFAIPADWPRYGGLDFGGVNTAAICYAKDPQSGAYYAIKEYHAGGKTSAEHATELKRWGCRRWVGGAKSEGQWRMEFSAAGLPIGSPNISDVEVGINRVYGLHKSDRLYIFDTLSRYKDEKGRYSRELDKSGQPTEKIKDKNDYHIMDAERYILPSMEAGDSEMPKQHTQKSKWSEHDIDEGSRWRD